MASRIGVLLVFCALFLHNSNVIITFAQQVGTCGVIDQRTWGYFGRTYASPNEFPWMVYLTILNKNSNSPIGCHGVLVSDSIILTTAGCVSKNSGKETAEVVVATIGRYNMSSQEKLSGEIQEITHLVHVHPRYSVNDTTGKCEFDFAAVQLQTPLRFSSSVAPICLPVDMCTDMDDHVDIADTCSLVVTPEWLPTDLRGKVGVMTKSMRNIKSHADCEKELQLPPDSLVSDRICASQLNEDACLGTSDGPLLCRYNNRFFVIGLMSQDYSSCNTDGNKKTSIYSRICQVLPWLRQLGLNVQPEPQKAPVTRNEMCKVPVIPNGSVTVSRGQATASGSLPFGSSISIRCMSNFKLIAAESSEHICSSGGRWFSGNFGVCVRGTLVQQQQQLPPPQRVSIQQQQPEQQRSPTNRVTTRLAPVAQQSVIRAVVEPITLACAQVPTVANGFFTSGSSTVGSIRLLICINYYTILGETLIRCTSQGTWSKPGSCVVNNNINNYAARSQLLSAVEVYPSPVLTCPTRYFPSLACYSTCSTDSNCPTGYLCCGTCPRLCEKGVSRYQQ